MTESNAGQQETGRGPDRNAALTDLIAKSFRRWGAGAVVRIVREEFTVVDNPKVSEYRIIGTGGG